MTHGIPGRDKMIAKVIIKTRSPESRNDVTLSRAVAFDDGAGGTTSARSFATRKYGSRSGLAI